MTLNIDAAGEDAATVDAAGEDRQLDATGAAQRRLADELLDELTAMKARDRMRMFHAWHQGGVSIVQLSAANLLTVGGADAHGSARGSHWASRSRARRASWVGWRTGDWWYVAMTSAIGGSSSCMPREGANELFRTLAQTRREQLSTLLEQLSESELRAS